MRRASGWMTLGAAAVAGVAFGCAAETPSVAPRISIASPLDDGTVTIDAQQRSPVVFAFENFTLKAPGAEGCGVGCGNVHLFIDGDDCTPAGSSSNNVGATSPMSALFGACANPLGDHTIALELHNADASPLLDSGGRVVSASVDVTTIAANTGAPSIAITMPTAGATVTLGMDVNKSVPITFTTENFTLAAPGTPGCGTGCGHVHITVDGVACNAPTEDYNAEGSASPVSALLAFCPAATGAHTVTAQLHNSDHSALGPVASSSVMFTTQ
jgi:hypothetical protein